MGSKTNMLLQLSVVFFVIIITSGCNQKKGSAAGALIFPKGAQGPAQNFIGNAFNLSLVPNDSTYQTLVGNVYFEPGARTNWHTHPSGQILIITDGEGFHQIKGELRQTLKKGDIVRCPPDVEHWHGARPDKSMSQLYIVPNTEKGIVNWRKPVSDEDYSGS